MHPVIAPLAAGFRMNTRLYLNCLDGLDDEAARARPSERVNSVAFLALHLADTRHWLVAALGADARNPFAALLKDASGIDALAEIPPLAEIREAWGEVSAVLDGRLAEVTDEEVRAPSPQRFPLDDPTLAGALSFLLTHDSYHVGQMAMLRKHLGFAPMRYT